MLGNVVTKSNGEVQEVQKELIHLDKPSITHLKVAPEKVARFERSGNDLVLHLLNGSVIAIQGFFIVDADGNRSDLVLEDDAGVLWWGQYNSPWQEFHFTEIEWQDGLAWLDGGSTLLPEWLAIGLGLLGLGAVLDGGGGKAAPPDEGGETPDPAPAPPPAPGGGGGRPKPPAPGNKPPVATADPVTTPEDTPVTGKVEGSDPDGDGLTYTVVTPPANGTVTIDPDTGEYTYTPDENFNGDDSFEVEVDDGKGGKTTVTVPVTITPVNDDPTTDDHSVTTRENTPVTGRVEGSDPDGDPLTYTKGSDPANGTVTVNPDGTWTYTPNLNYEGDDEFTVIVDDGNGGTATSTIRITVEPLDNTPSISNDAATTPEDTPVVIDVLANDTDLDGDPLTITHIGGQLVTPGDTVDVPNGTATLNPDGTITFTPAPDYHGPAEFTYTATDGTTPVTANVSVTVTPVNDAPVAGDDNATTGVDTPVTIQVGNNDADPDGDPLTITEINGQPVNPGETVGVPNGTATLNPDGTITFEPDPGYTGPVEFTYTVTDGTETSTATVAVTVTEEGNQPPSAADDANTTSEDVTLVVDAADGVILNGAGQDSDPDGDTLTVTAVGFGATPGTVGTELAGDWGTLTLYADGGYSYVPNAAAQALKDGESESDVFTYTVSDPAGGTATATLTITVTGANDAPLAVNDSLTAPQDTPVTIPVLANDSDPDGDSLTITHINGQPVSPEDTVAVPHGNVTLNPDGTLTFVPDPGYNGPVDFPYTITDGTGTSTANVHLVIDDVNDPPIAQDNTVQGTEDSAVNFDPRSNDVDPDGDPLTITHINGQPIDPSTPVSVDHGTISQNPDGSLTFTPDPDWNGSFDVEYTIDDGRGGTDTATVTINISPVNDPVVAADDSYEVAEDGSVVLDLLGNDSAPDGGLAVTAINGTALTGGEQTIAVPNGVVEVAADGTLTFVPEADYHGPVSFDYEVEDADGDTDTATVMITVTPVNDPPVFEQPSDPSDPDSPLVPVDPSTGYSFDYDENSPADTVLGQVQASDVDGDTVTYSIVSGNDDGWYAIDPATGEITLTAAGAAAEANDYEAGPASHPLVVRADDGTVTVDIPVTLNERDLNDAPVPVDPNEGKDPGDPDYVPGQTFDPSTGNYGHTTPEDTPVSGRVVGEDPDGDTLTYTKGSDPANGTVVVNPDGTYTYTPDEDYNGPDEFTVIVDDGNGGTVTSTVTITVTPVNDDPVPVDPNEGKDPGDPDYVPGQTFDPSTGNYGHTTPEDTPVSGRVVGEDPDGDTLTYTKGSDPANGTVVVNPDGTYTYTPDEDYNGPDEFTVIVDDGNGGTVTSTVTITVTPVNDDPVFVDPSDPTEPVTSYTFSYDENRTAGTALGTVQATDIDSATVTYAIDPASNPNGWYAIDPNTGEITLTAAGAASEANDFEAGGNSQEITVVATDSDGGTTTITVTLNEQDLNDNAPVVGDGSVTVSEEGLPGGLPDNAGNPIDSTDAVTQTGTISISDADASSTLTVTLSGPAGLTSGGVAVTWSGDGTAGNPLVGTAGGKEILEATIDNAGNYEVTLKGPIDHPAGNGENLQNIGLTVSASDGVHTSTGTLTVTVEDDAPVAAPSSAAIVLPEQNSNILLILDVSGSMSTVDSGTGGKSRLQIMKEAINLMLDSYDVLGDIKVRIVTFSSSGQQQGGGWLDIDQAKTIVNGLAASGTTAYRSALNTAMTAYETTGKLADGNNIAYFLTDGEPSSNQDINAATQTAWENFLNTNDINAHAYGMGPAAPQGPINPAAYNGVTGTDTDAIVVADTSQLPPILRDSVGVNTGGSVITGGGLGTSGLGADGGGMASVTVNGRTYHADGTVTGGTSRGTWSAATQTWTINTEGEGGDANKGGKLVVGMDDGAYTYTPPLIATGSTHAENVGFVLIDADGDTAGSTLNITVHPPGTILPNAVGFAVEAEAQDDDSAAMLMAGVSESDEPQTEGSADDDAEEFSLAALDDDASLSGGDPEDDAVTEVDDAPTLADVLEDGAGQDDEAIDLSALPPSDESDADASDTDPTAPAGSGGDAAAASVPEPDYVPPETPSSALDDESLHNAVAG